MADEPITPALTPDEWAALALSGRGRTEPLFPAFYDREDREVVLGGAWVHSDEAHAIAALCLHDQPFGFIPFHVDLLLTVAAEREEFVPTDERAEELRYLAARIAALLPPE